MEDKNNLLDELYNYMMNNAYGKELSLEKIMEEFSITRDELLTKMYILNKERGMPIRLSFNIKKEKRSEKTICRICKRRQGDFRATKIDVKNKDISGIFVCESCYRNKEKYEKFVEDLEAKKRKQVSEEDLVICPACKNKTLLWFPDSNFGYCTNIKCAKRFEKRKK